MTIILNKELADFFDGYDANTNKELRDVTQSTSWLEGWDEAERDAQKPRGER